MPPELDNATVIAELLLVGMFACSAALWISHLKEGKQHSKPRASAPTWSIGWANFGLFLCTLVISISFTQTLATKLVHTFAKPVGDEQKIEEIGISDETIKATDPNHSEIPEETAPPVPTPWIAVLSLLSMQIPMMATFYGLRTFYPQSFGGSINQKPVSLRKAISETIPHFIRCFPVIWLTGLVWLGLLTGLQKLEIVDEFPPQQLVTIVRNNEAPFAIAIIAICAVVSAPLVEEIVFRGAIYQFLKGHIPLLAAQVFSGALFAIVHFNLMSFLPLLVIGVFLARIYEKEGNILLPILFHICWNGFSLLILFLTSPSEVPLGSNGS